MGRKEFYEKMEELKLIRLQVLNPIQDDQNDEIRMSLLRQVDDQADHQKLLQQNGL